MEGIEKFDASRLMDGVKDRIKATFVGLIPDEQWNAMVQKEIDDYFKQKDRSGYGQRQYDSDFGLMCKQLLHEEAKKRILVILESPEFNSTWDNSGKPIIGTEIKKLIMENSGELLVQLLSQPFVQGIENMKYQMRNAGQ